LKNLVAEFKEKYLQVSQELGLTKESVSLQVSSFSYIGNLKSYPITIP
jgi:hypothetical protein